MYAPQPLVMPAPAVGAVVGAPYAVPGTRALPGAPVAMAPVAAPMAMAPMAAPMMPQPVAAPTSKIGKRGLPVTKKADFELGKPFNKLGATRGIRGLGGGETHMLICALDYIGSASPLTCSIDGKNMQALAQAAGISDVVAMYNDQCSKQQMIAALKQTAAKCKPGDTFFFFFAGHGMSSTDYDGDEPDGKDENYVCDFTNQRMDPAKHYLSDDEFAALLTSSLNKEVNIIVVSDCCHSGSVCDFARNCWKGFNAVSISGCRDTQTSGDTGKGGICTHSMMLAIEQLLKEGKTSFSCGELYRKTVYFDDTMMASSQDIQFDKAPDTRPNSVPWPLIPKGPFQAPYNSASGLLGGGAAAPTMGAPMGATTTMGAVGAAPFSMVTAAPGVKISTPGMASAGTAIAAFGTAAPITIQPSAISPSPVFAGGYPASTYASGFAGGLAAPVAGTYGAPSAMPVGYSPGYTAAQVI